jgi:polar amino acid transport system substrate-binding protein
MPGRGIAKLPAVLTPAGTGVAALVVVTAVLMTTLGGGGAPEGPVRQAQPEAVHPANRPEATTKEPGCDADNVTESPEQPSAQDGEAVERIRHEQKKLVIGIDQNTYHWGYRDPHEKDPAESLKGFDIELAKTIARSVFGAGFPVEFKAVATNDRARALKDEEIDMVVRTMTINCERRDQVAFSTAYFEANQRILASKDTKIDALEDMTTMRVCAAEESTGSKWVGQWREGVRPRRLVQVPNQLDCLVKLQMGEVDAVATDNTLAAAQAAQDPTVEVKDAPAGDQKEWYGVAMRKGDTDLVARVNQVLQEYRDDANPGNPQSPWHRSYDRWLKHDGLDVTQPPGPRYRDDG